MNTERERDLLIGQLYDGVMDAAAWFDALDTLNDQLHSVGVHQFSIDIHSSKPLQSHSTLALPLETIREYENHLANDDPRMELCRRVPVGEIIVASERFSASVMSKHPIFAVWLKAIGLVDTLAVRLGTDGRQNDFLGFFRSKDTGTFAQPDKSTFELVLPHLQRANALRSRMCALERQAAIGLSALDRLPHSVFIVDEHSRIQHLNHAAEKALASRRVPCRVEHEALRFAASEVDAQFQNALKAACHSGLRTEPGSFQVGVESNQWYGITVLPLKASHRLASFREINLAIVVVADPTHALASSAALLSELLRVTLTEARLALALADGSTLQEFARRANISWHTARTHLKNLQRKTDCHTHADIVRLVHRLHVFVDEKNSP